MSLTQAELNEIKERAEKVSPGPWVKTFATGIEIVCDFGMKIISDDSGVIRYSDAEFIANAREDIPRLVAEIEQLDLFLQEIDTHIRSTPEPLPYIIETMRNYLDYREELAND